MDIAYGKISIFIMRCYSKLKKIYKIHFYFITVYSHMLIPDKILQSIA